VYVKFYDEDDTTKALDGLRGRYYAGRPVVVELSPVTDFREARCRQYDVGECNRGGFCNFMHLGEPSRETQDKLFSWQRKLQRRKRAAKKKTESEQRDKERAEREKERAERDKDRKQEPADDRRSSTRKSRWDRQTDGGDVDRERRERENERRDRERADKERRDRRRERDIDEEGERDNNKRRKDEEEEKPQVYDVALPPNFDGDEDVKNEDDNIKTEFKAEDGTFVKEEGGEIKMELDAQ
jgi:splicing factor U2AF subunit